MEIKRNLSDDIEVGARPPVQNLGGGGGGGEKVAFNFADMHLSQ